MARCIVHKNTDDGYLLDAQADLLEAPSTRMVAPLPPCDQAPQMAQRIKPIFEIDGKRSHDRPIPGRRPGGNFDWAGRQLCVITTTSSLRLIWFSMASE